jgi:hypothetical protein
LADKKEVQISILGEASKFNETLDRVGKKTEDFEGQLAGLSKVSGAAFVSLTAAIGLSIKEFAESEAVMARVEAVIKATGGAAGVSGGQVQELADKFSAITLFGDEAIASAEGILLSFRRIGKDVFPEATEATLDLATRLGVDAPQAAQVLGKALNNPIEGLGALRKAGIDFTDAQEKQIKAMVAAGDVAGAQRLVLDELKKTMGGLAQAATDTTAGAFIQLQKAFGDVAKEVGKNLAPAFKLGAEALSSVLGYAKDHPQVTKLAAAVAVGATAATGLATAAGTAGLAMLKFRAAMIAAGVAANGTKIATQALLGATGIGLLVVIATEVALNWNTVWPRTQAVFKAFASNVGNLAANLGGLLGAVFTFDFGEIKNQLGLLKSTLKAGYEEAFAAIPERKMDAGKDLSQDGTDKERDKFAKETALQKAADDEKARNDLEAKAKELERNRQHAEILQLEAAGASAELLKLKKEEGELRLAMIDADTDAEREWIIARYQQVQELVAEQTEIEREQRQLLRDEILTQNEEFNLLTEEQQAMYLQRSGAALQASIDTQKTAQKRFLDDRLKEMIASNNLFLQEQMKYNTAYATVNQYLRDSEVGKSLTFFSTMQRMQQSNLGVLRTIGKAAALAQIAMDTARGATQALTAFPIPFVGPALGMAAAAAIVAFGVEQAARVTGIVGAADGGVMMGGMPGMDSIPAMLMPGELVAPTRNFDEVVNAVARERAARGELAGVTATGSEMSPGGPVEVRVEIDLTRRAGEVITARQVEDEALGLSRRAS